MNSAYRKKVREEQKNREKKFFLFWTSLNLAVGALGLLFVYAVDHGWLS